MSDKYGATEMVIPSTTSKPSFGTRVKNHFKRFWWAHVIAFIVIVLVVVLPVYVSPDPISSYHPSNQTNL